MSRAGGEKLEGKQAMTGVVSEYFDVLAEVGVDDFSNPCLEAIRRRMTREDTEAVLARLRCEAEVRRREADELER
jgi:hypothetical protein